MAKRWTEIDWGEKIIIVMIGMEIVLSLAAIGLTVYEAEGQDQLLRNLLAAQIKVDADLSDVDSRLRDLDVGMNKTADAVTKSATTSSSINDALRSQLRILAEEQKQRLAELARKPEVHATIDGVRIDSNQPLTPKEFSDEKAVFEIVVQNTGDLALVNGLVRIGVDSSEIKLSASYSTPLPLPSDLAKTGNAILIPLNRLSRPAWQLIAVTVEYPKGTLPFSVSVTVDADNLPLTSLGQIRVRPPAAANPFVFPH